MTFRALVLGEGPEDALAVRLRERQGVAWVCSDAGAALALAIRGRWPDVVVAPVGSADLLRHVEALAASVPAASRPVILSHADDSTSRGPAPPVDIEELCARGLQRAEERSLAARAQPALGAALEEVRGLTFGGSAAIAEVLRSAEDAARRVDQHVLIEGEAGVGKATLATWIHARMPTHGPLHRVCAFRADAADLRLRLLGSPSSPGALRRFDAETILLEDIADLPQDLQREVLLALETPGIPRELAHDCTRVVATTRTTINAEVRAGRLNADLLRHFPLRILIPPLRDRMEDVLPVARALADRLGRRLGKPLVGLRADAEAMLVSHPFPHNVRELANVIERAAMVESSDSMSRASLSLGPAIAVRGDRGAWGGPKPPTLAQVERDYVTWLLSYTGGNFSEAARLMGVSYPTIKKKIVDYQIDPSLWKRARSP